MERKLLQLIFSRNSGESIVSEVSERIKLEMLKGVWTEIVAKRWYILKDGGNPSVYGNLASPMAPMTDFEHKRERIYWRPLRIHVQSEALRLAQVRREEELESRWTNERLMKKLVGRCEESKPQWMKMGIVLRRLLNNNTVFRRRVWDLKKKDKKILKEPGKYDLFWKEKEKNASEQNFRNI